MPNTPQLDQKHKAMRWIDTDPEEIKLLLSQSQAVLVMNGAGISTSAGIPDFRSHNGLYVKGHIFSELATLTHESRSQSQKSALALYDLAKASEPTDTHRFLVGLRNAGKLLRAYTQNIDMLEAKVGLSTDLARRTVDCIPLHGSVHQLRCTFCTRVCLWDGYESQVHEAYDIPCPDCTIYSENRIAAGKRRAPIGMLLPNIIRIGQEHPYGDRIAELANLDQEASDVFLILGTSLKAYGAFLLAKQFAKATRSRGGTVIFVNTDPPRTEMHGLIDFWEPYDCDAWVREMKCVIEPSGAGESCSSISRELPLGRRLCYDVNERGSTPWNPIELD